jgi:hypothetical protein
VDGAQQVGDCAASYRICIKNTRLLHNLDQASQDVVETVTIVLTSILNDRIASYISSVTIYM